MSVKDTARVTRIIGDRLPRTETLKPKQNRSSLRTNARVAGRERLIDFCEAVDPNASLQAGGGYRAKHLALIAEKLEAVERGEIKRLMIFMPPRHWKSSLCSEKFPAWYLGRNPDREIISTSYADSLAIDFSSKVRDLIGENEAFRELFPKVRLKRGSKSKANWSLVGAYRSSYRAAGLAGGITGRGADLIMIDDPVADDKAVATKEGRDSLYSWYQAKLRNRLEPGGAIVLIMTRWHEDDLAGRLLRAASAGEGEQWVVVSLPAIAEPKAVIKEGADGEEAYVQGGTTQYVPKGLPEDLPDSERVPEAFISPSLLEQVDEIGRKAGEVLWPERYPVEEYYALRLSSGPKNWASLYQQRPRPDSGNILDSSKLRMIDLKDVPALRLKFRHWDLAFSDANGADYLAGVLGGTDKKNNFYILHIKRLRGSWPTNKPKICALSQVDGPNAIVSVEANGTQLGYYQDVKADPSMRGRIVRKYIPEGKKEMRAALWGSHLDAGPEGKIFCVRGEWNLDFFDEMDGFPNATHDDMIDGVSGLWKLCLSKEGAGMYSF